MTLRFATLALLAWISVVLADPTMYKKNEQNLYEPDLIAVSSTVMPEEMMPNKDEITAEMDQQYKKAFYNLYKKKFNSKLEKADTLLTDKKKFNKIVKDLSKKN